MRVRVGGWVFGAAAVTLMPHPNHASVEYLGLIERPSIPHGKNNFSTNKTFFSLILFVLCRRI